MALPERPFSPLGFAKALGCSRHTVDEAIKNKTIPAVRIGRRYFIPHRIGMEILENGRIPQIEGVTREAM